jgi:hypothetical protein
LSQSRQASQPGEDPEYVESRNAFQ